MSSYRSPLGRRLAARSAPLLLCVTGAGLWSIAAGLDDTWDLQHYHLVNAYEVLEGRLGRDISVAGMHSTFSPLLDLPYYIIAVKLFPTWPRLVCFLAGLPYGVLAWVCFGLVRRSGVANSPLQVAVIALIGMSGSDLVVEIGLTFGDLPVAVLVLAALWALLWPPPSGPGAKAGDRSRLALLGGLAAGAAAALKLTAAVYPPCLLVALLAARRRERGMARHAASFVAGCAVGFVVLYGPWGFYLWRHYDSPFFPLFNNWFHSPWAAFASARDMRYLPGSLLEALFYPLFWLHGRAKVVEETGVRDWHFAIAYLAIVALALALAAWRDRRAGAAPPRDPRHVVLCVFFVTAFAAWEAMFSILRYAAPLEAITGIVIAIAVRRVPARMRLISLVAILAFLLLTGGWPGWGRARAGAAGVFSIEAPDLPDAAVVAVPSVPTAYVLPFLRGRDLTFVGLEATPDTLLARAITARLDQAASIWVLMLVPDARTDARLRQFGLSPDMAACGAVVTHRRDWGRMVLCPARRRPAGS